MGGNELMKESRGGGEKLGCYTESGDEEEDVLQVEDEEESSRMD